MRVFTSIVAGAGLLLMSVIALAADVDGLDITIRVIDNSAQSSATVTHELSLPDMPSMQPVNGSTTANSAKKTPEATEATSEATDVEGHHKSGHDNKSLKDRDRRDEALQTRDSMRESQDTLQNDVTGGTSTGTGFFSGGGSLGGTSGGLTGGTTGGTTSGTTGTTTTSETRDE